MDEDDRRERIVRLEAEIDELAETIERCRKIGLIARAAVALGAMLMLAVMFSAIRFDPAALIAAIALLTGGIVVLGSNRSTSQQALGRLRAAEANRAELIGQLDLTPAGDNRLG
jgi:predicted nucleic acid-binding protein